MISFLEKYNIPWTPIVTKCDLLRKDDLARRITLLKSDLSEYHRLQGEPIPVSAKKMMGMQEIRKILDPLKLKRKVTSHGHTFWVYDLLELRRLKNRERRRRVADKKREKEHEKELAKKAAEENAVPGDAVRDALKRGVGSSVEGAHPSAPLTSAAPLASEPFVSEAQYGLDDRDSKRAENMFRSMFPDLPEIAHEDVQQRNFKQPLTYAHSTEGDGKVASKIGASNYFSA